MDEVLGGIALARPTRNTPRGGPRDADRNNGAHRIALVVRTHLP
ncbi:hypothetical protein HMPREF0682_1239 [Propionibacterium acidifaciens F0233]|uniref:Uncharacterized protein n=1 Tax=Propionibacterium acidifaciens F0233 TaxID=553198 RepID=U2RKH9_9ACTN|nr:hypothetical protein HMPREF0682_1239 [Propionibacterium acidifaciens F0233]